MHRCTTTTAAVDTAPSFVTRRASARLQRFLCGITIPLVVAACGGGSDDPAPTPVDLKFQVRASYANIVTKGFSVNIGGRDNVIPASNDPTAFEVIAPGTAAEIRRPVENWNDWSGVMRVSSRNGPPENTPTCGSATRQIDILVSLQRNRDGYRTQDGLTIGYTSDFKPICAFRLDGTYWEWNRSAPLPLTAALGNLDGVQFTGTLVRGPNQADPDQDNTESSLTSTTTLDSATDNSAILNFVYKTTRLFGSPPPENQTTLLGVSTELGFRITPDGALLGIRYRRTGPLDNDLEKVVTLSLSSE